MRKNYRNNEDAGDLTAQCKAEWAEAQAEERDDENYAFGGQHQADIAAEERAERAAENSENSKNHPFEKAGLGSAPFRCVGMHVEVGPIQRGSMSIGAPGQPMGTCDFCGNGIKYVYDIVSSNGNDFGVGCECVLKTDGVSTKLTKQVKTIKRNHDRKLRQERKAKKDQERRDANEAIADDLLETNPELAKALETDHYIIRDIASRLRQWGNISQAQIALVFKIADQVADRKAQEESFIAVPRIAGRQTIVGKVVATKWDTAYFGYNSCTTSLKGLIIVDTPEGSWKTWGTIPESCYSGSTDTAEWIKGRTIQFDARVKVAPNDPMMSFFNRPSKGTEVK
jgi:hypothetical protein